MVLTASLCSLYLTKTVGNQYLLSEKLKMGQPEHGVFHQEASASTAKNFLLITASFFQYEGMSINNQPIPFPMD